jgi:hypothetical protein
MRGQSVVNRSSLSHRTVPCCPVADLLFWSCETLSQNASASVFIIIYDETQNKLKNVIKCLAEEQLV